MLDIYHPLFKKLVLSFFPQARVASVPVRAKSCLSRASEDCGRAKIRARAEKEFSFVRRESSLARDTELFARAGTLATQAILSHARRCFCFLQHSHVAVKLDVLKSVKVNVKVADDLGEVEFGKLDQEYFKDPDLRDLLAKTALDANRMEGLEDQKLRLIYLVIYSERFLLKGKRKHEVFIWCI